MHQAPIRAARPIPTIAIIIGAAAFGVLAWLVANEAAAFLASFIDFTDFG